MNDVIKRLREVNEEVPTPLRLPSDEEIQQAESALNMDFHPDYRRYLKEASDVTYGVLEPLVVVSGYDALYLPIIAKEAWEYGLPKECLPICEDNGDYFAIDPNGQIIFWSHGGLADEKWADLATWIKEVWLEE